MPDRYLRTTVKDNALINQRRHEITAAAVKLFLRKGFQATTTREVAEACGLSPGGLFQYIGSKEDILHLICIDHSTGAEPYRLHLSTLGEVSRTEALCECIAYYFQHTASLADYLIFFNREIFQFSREDRRMLLASQTDIQSFFEQLMRDGIETGEFRLSNPTVAAHNILMYGHDWGLRRWFLKEHVSLEEYTRIQTQMLLAAVAPRDSQVVKTEQSGLMAQIPTSTSAKT